MTLWLYESMIRFIYIYISSICSLLSDHGISVWACSFPSLLRLGKYVFPCKKDLNTHTQVHWEKILWPPKMKPFFFGCAYLEHCFFHVGSLWGLWRWCGKLFERTTGLLAIFIDNQVWVGEIQTWTKPRDMRDSKQKLSLNFFAKVRVVWILHSLICHLFESCFFTPVIRYLPVVGCFPLTFLV